MAEDENTLPGVMPYMPAFKPFLNTQLVQELVVEDYIADCQRYIEYQFSKLGIKLEIRLPAAPFVHYPRRPRSVWG